jgi:hypothetical protein
MNTVFLQQEEQGTRATKGPGAGAGGSKAKTDQSKPKPTISDAKNFNPDNDVERLHEAMKGLGTDETTIIEILTNRSNAQRQTLKRKYKDKYKKV